MAVPPGGRAAIRRLLAAVRPHPHRGDLIAAAAVPLTLGVLVTELRFNGVWGRGVLFVLAVLACGLVLGMGLLAPLEEERPRAYQTVLLVAGLALLAVVLLRLAQVLGEDRPLAAAGTMTWMATLFAGAAAVPAWRLRSPICALIEFVAGGVVLLAFVDWVFSPRGPDTFRWLLLILILTYAGMHVRLRDRWPRHAVHAVNAAGLAALVIAWSFQWGFLLPNRIAGGRPGTWWELVILVVGCALVAYAAVDHEPGPGYLGVFALLLFVVLAGTHHGGVSLIGWPILLLLLGGAGVAAGLRPRRDLPPEPGPPEPPPPRPLTGDEPTEVQR